MDTLEAVRYNERAHETKDEERNDRSGSDRLERVHPVEEPAAADPQLLGNLVGGELPAGSQSRSQQSLLAFDIPANLQLNGHGLR